MAAVCGAQEWTQRVSTHTARDAWVGGPPNNAVLLPETQTLIVKKGWHEWGRADFEAMSDLADVIVLNYGIHYQASAPPPGSA